MGQPVVDLVFIRARSTTMQAERGEGAGQGAQSRLAQARLALHGGRVDAAVSLLEEAVEAAYRADDRRGQAEGLVELSRALQQKGQLEPALLCAERAAGAARTGRAPALVADACLQQVSVLEAQGHPAQARARRDEAAQALEEAAKEARAKGDLALLAALLDRAVSTRDAMLAAQGSAAPTTRVLHLEAADRRGQDDKKRDELLRTLFSLSRQLVEERDPERVVMTILDSAVQATGAERGFVLLAPAADEPAPATPSSRLPGGLEVAAARNFDKATVRRAEVKVSRAILEEALRQKAPLVVHDAGDDAALAGHTSVQEQKLRSIVVVPFESARAAGVRGALYLDNRFSPGAFAGAALEALNAFAAHAAVALENARLHARAAREREALDKARAEAEALAKRLEVELSRTGEELGVVRERLERTQGQLAEKSGLGEIVGRSRLMQPVYAFVTKVAATDHPVLVRGESGTGKELVARAIHFEGPRRGAPFVSENCGAIPETLLESTLFGHEAGAFTGATERRPGIFELAGKGTLFLDEVGELPLASQAALLRVLEERRVRRVGGQDEVPVHARLVCATHRDLEQMVRAGSFREDLYYRLNVLAVRLPPLRDRRDDLALLLDKLLERAATKMERRTPAFDPDARRALLRYDWPGNVRELENELQRLLTLGGDPIELADLSPAVRGETATPIVAGATGAPAQAIDPSAIPTLDEGEKRLIVAALAATGGNKIRAAALLGIPRGTLWHKMKQHKLG